MLVHHEFVDGMFFPVDEKTTVLVGLVRPYDPEAIASKVQKKVALAFKAGNL
jgi:hypothetical protein